MVRALVFSWIVLVFGLMAPPQGEAKAKDAEYQQMLNRLNKRYEGFFIYHQDKKRTLSRRLSGVPAHKKQRQQTQKSKERIRKSFVRKPPASKESLRLKWERQQKQLAQKREMSRKAFVKKRNRVERVKSTARKVPANQDVGLE